MKTIQTIVVLCLSVFMFIAEGVRTTPNHCVVVEKNSVHAYYDPAFETALVGWFVEDTELKLVRTKETWGLVTGHGKDAQLRNTRISGWVLMSNMTSCQ